MRKPRFALHHVRKRKHHPSSLFERQVYSIIGRDISRTLKAKTSIVINRRAGQAPEIFERPPKDGAENRI